MNTMLVRFPNTLSLFRHMYTYSTREGYKLIARGTEEKGRGGHENPLP